LVTPSRIGMSTISVLEAETTTLVSERREAHSQWRRCHVPLERILGSTANSIALTTLTNELTFKHHVSSIQDRRSATLQRRFLYLMFTGPCIILLVE
jgi:hypothetical protein